MRRSSPFLSLAQALDRVKATRSKKEKVSILAEFMSKLDPDDAEDAARMAVGLPSERGSKEETQVGYSTLVDVLMGVSGASSRRISEAFLKHGDLGEVAEELLARKAEQTLFDEPLTLADLHDAFERLREVKGKGSALTRQGMVKSLILRASPLEGKYILKILTREMRTGMVSGLMEEAVSSAYGASKEETARAHMLLGDIGLLAKAAANGSLTEVKMTPFRPVNFMLAEPVASAEEIAVHFGKKVYAEYKYDGVRAQVHKLGADVRVYSRRLEDVSPFFPEVTNRASGSTRDFIMDGEIVPFANGKPLPFQLLQRRLRRQEDFEEASRDAPVEFFAFDILFEGGREVTGLPLSERRELLELARRGTGIWRAETMEVAGAAEIETQFRKSRELGYEGLVMKDPGSPYTMGKRGSAWVKLKEELDTLDVVIVAAEYGNGKRAGVISDYTFAVKDGDGLKTIGKAYSGLTDVEIDEMTARLKAITVKDHGHSRTVRPEVVLEVAFDSIQESARHDSGYALRFPRIKRVRRDKSAADIDTIEKVQDAFGRQKLKLEKPRA